MAAWSRAKFSLKAKRSGAEGTTVWTKLDKTLTGIAGKSNSLAPRQSASNAKTLSANAGLLAAGTDWLAEATAFELEASGRAPIGERLAC